MNQRPAHGGSRGLERGYDSVITDANNTVKTPGVGNMWSMPIKNRPDMLGTGIKTPVGIKIFGPDLAVLDQIGRQIGLIPILWSQGVRGRVDQRS